MKCGDVLFWKDFVFADGGFADKLLIVLNTPQENEDLLVVPVTSKQKYKKDSPGCYYEDNYYFIPMNQTPFKVNTWVIFEEYYLIPINKVISQGINGNMFSKFSLTTDVYRSLKNCILKSPDISGIYADIIRKAI